MKYISYICSIIIALFILNACAKQNAGIVKQTYHDLTSHYNGYFNANENFNEQINNVSKSRKENYDEILPLYAYGNLNEVKSASASLKSSIEKAQITVQTHQEKAKSKAYVNGGENSISNWSDDAFLLIGKSYYLQGSLDSSIACFRYITANFEEAVDARSKNKIKKQNNNKKRNEKAKKLEDKLIELEKKGKDIRPSKKITAHESANSEALVWLCKAYISQKDYSKSEAILTYIRSDKNFLKNYDKEVELANAFLYLEQENYNEAIPFIEKSLELIKKQKNKVRYQFILGQLHEKTNHKAIAADYYKQSMKANANFEMVFYAKLKLIQMSREDKYNEKEAAKLLAKMLHDNKNKNYFDQLYYEKALLALNEKDRESAKKFLNKSIAVSTVNTKQKGSSYLALANMNYEEESYAISQQLYDSALTLINDTHLEYELAKNRSLVLTELVLQLNTITLNDSLLTLGNIPEKELESYLYKLAVDEIDLQIKNEAKNKQANNLSDAAASSSAKTDKNSWYFYSDASKNSGYKKFKQKWGDITLEDNWRRSDKGSEAGDLAEDNKEEDEYFKRIDARYQDMLASIPKSESDKDLLKDAIIDAYYEGAIVYKVGLNNLPKSVEMFELLNSKYNANVYEPENLYQLFVLYSDLENVAKANKAKADLLSKYPNCKYAEYIKNPASLSPASSDIDVASYYEESYNLYLAEAYDDVILRCEQSRLLYRNNELQAKFDLLKAMSIGGKKLLDPFIVSLEYVVKTYKSTPEQEKAQEMLAYLKGEVQDEKPIGQEKITPNNIKGDKTLEMDKNLDKDSLKDEKSNGLKLKLGEKELNIGGKKDTKKEE